MNTKAPITLISIFTLSSIFFSLSANNKIAPIIYKKGDFYGYKDSISGSRITSAKFDVAFPFKNDTARVLRNKKIGIIKIDGNPLISPKYDKIFSYKENAVRVVFNKKYGFVDEKGIKFCSTKYDEARDFREGYAAVKLNKKWGFIDKKGNLVIKCKYNEVSDFIGGMAAVSTDDEDFTINYQEERVVPKY